MDPIYIELCKHLNIYLQYCGNINLWEKKNILLIWALTFNTILNIKRWPPATLRYSLHIPVLIPHSSSFLCILVPVLYEVKIIALRGLFATIISFTAAHLNSNHLLQLLIHGRIDSCFYVDLDKLWPKQLNIKAKIRTYQINNH